jgi:hypothetical protein
MQYRVAYDVSQEWYDLRMSLMMLVPFGLSVLFLVVFWVAAWHDLREPDRSKRSGLGTGCGPVLALAFPLVLVLCAGWLVCRPLVPQWRAKAWARAGDNEVTEGAVSGLGHGRRGRTYFTVAGVSFQYLPWNAEGASGGFRGTFTDPGVPEDALRDGVPVRITHHDDCILRIEIAEPESREE